MSINFQQKDQDKKKYYANAVYYTKVRWRIKLRSSEKLISKLFSIVIRSSARTPKL